MLPAVLSKTMVTRVHDDYEFEERIMHSDECWAVLYVSDFHDSRDQLFEDRVARALPPGLHFAAASESTLHLQKLGQFAFEYDHRLHKPPLLLVFTSKGERKALIVDVAAGEGDLAPPLSVHDIQMAVMKAVKLNKMSKADVYLKHSLTVHGQEVPKKVIPPHEDHLAPRWQTGYGWGDEWEHAHEEL